MNLPSTARLMDLRSLRTAPLLSPEQAKALAVELAGAMGRCSWFTVGVMAPSPAAAIAALRALEHRCGWLPLEPDPAVAAVAVDQPVFLKGNQHSGCFAVRAEQGLGSGILVTGHNPDDVAAEDTWGPLPLDFFGP
jgi:hypothetical protein